METVESVVKAHLCMGCGTCAGICPVSAIRMDISSDEAIYTPIIDIYKCTKCKLCINVCPGVSVDFHKYNNEIFYKQPSEPWIGNYIACYIGHSNNNDIRYNATSGGLVTQILLYLLEKGLIDGALVTRMNRNNPTKPEPFIARTEGDIITASKAKYCPVPANMAIKQILKEEGKFAVVGLPCHLHGIRKAETFIPSLKKKIVLHVGLLCSHMVNFKGTEFLFNLKKVKIENISKLSYRGSGWPGKMIITLKNHFSIDIPYTNGWNSYWPIFSSHFFTPIRCMMCPDLTAEMADISLGDAWLPELMSDTNGQSIIISRNQYSDDLLHDIYYEDMISIKKVSIKNVNRSQLTTLIFKKYDLGNRLELFKLMNQNIPFYYPFPEKHVDVPSRLRNMFAIFNMNLSSKTVFRNIIVHIPLPLFRLYYGVMKMLYMIK